MQSPNLNNLLTRLRTDFPDLVFEPGERFLFHPPRTIHYVKKSPDEYSALLLLHELGHALTGKYDYHQDIELIQIESEAWAKSRELCRKYHVKFDEDFAEANLDSYRDWLHANSLCPNCQINGYQDLDGRYHCPLCNKKWHSKYRAF